MNGKPKAGSSGASRSRWGGRQGITLIELLGVLFIISLLIVAASPFFKTMTKAGQASAAAREVYTDLVRARSEAVRSRLPHLVEFCGQQMEGFGQYSDAGYVVIECPADYQGDCVNRNPCAMIRDETLETNPHVKIVVNLTKGNRAFGSTHKEFSGLTSVRFGWDPNPGGGMTAILDDRQNMTKSTPSASYPDRAPRTFGVDLPAGNWWFFFKPNGQVGDSTASHLPGGGALYLRAAMNKDPNFVRAVDISSTGSMRVYRWDDTLGKWR